MTDICRSFGISARAARIGVAAAIAFGAIVSHEAQAQAPKTIRILVPFPAGGPTDTVARVVSEQIGKQHNINVIVENHGGLSSNGKWLASVIEQVGMPNCGTLPDFGNFNIAQGKPYDRYLGVTELMPFAKGVSAKSYAFDAKGNETTIDYLRMLRIVRDAGFRGHVGIEFEGRNMEETEGVRATLKLLERVREELQPA